MDPTVPVVPDRPHPRGTARDRVVEWVRWFGPGRLVAGTLSLAGVALAAFWLVRGPAPRVEDGLPMATTTTSVAAATTIVGGTADSSAPEPREIVVHVAGAVASPGVRRLPAGARVVDAIESAGGLTPEAAADNINLAAPLHDGDRIYVPRAIEASEVPAGVTPAPTEASDSGTASPVPLNTATAVELDALPGIGPSLAAAIVAHRDERGPFLTVEQLADVSGIGPAKLAALRELVTV